MEPVHSERDDTARKRARKSSPGRKTTGMHPFQLTSSPWLVVLTSHVSLAATVTVVRQMRRHSASNTFADEPLATKPSSSATSASSIFGSLASHTARNDETGAIADAFLLERGRSVDAFPVGSCVQIQVHVRLAHPFVFEIARSVPLLAYTPVHSTLS